MSDSVGTFATATITVPASGNFSAQLIPTRPVPCNSTILIVVQCVEDPVCRLAQTAHFLCDTCPIFTTSIVAGDCDDAGNRAYAITITVTDPCDYKINVPGGGAPIPVSMTAPGSYTLNASLPAGTSSNTTINVNVTKPDGCPGIDIIVPVTKCPPPCPEPQFGTPTFSDCTPQKDRMVTGWVTVNAAGVYSYPVTRNGQPLGTVDNSNPTLNYNLVLAGGSSHVIKVDLPPPCGDSSITIDVPTCDFRTKPCPDVVVTPTFGECQADGTRLVNLTVSATGTPGYGGSVLVDGSYMGPVADGAPWQQQLAMSGGAHVVQVDAVTPASCGTVKFKVDVPACKKTEDPTTPGDPKIPCVLCTWCQDVLTKWGYTIWRILGCKLLMLLIITAIPGLFVQASLSLSGLTNANFDDLGWLLWIVGGSIFAFIFVLQRFCGNCCVYCAILAGVLLGLVLNIVALIWSQGTLWWAFVLALIVAFILLSVNEFYFKPRCEKERA